MASIRACRTSRDQRRYEVRFRDARGRERSQRFTTHRDAQAFKLDVERRQQAGVLYDAPPERFGDLAQSWLERYVVGAAGRVRPRPKSVALTHENLAALAPLRDLTIDRIHRPLVEDFVTQLAARTPRRAEMVLALLKRILKAAEERGQRVDPSVFAVRLARTEEREPHFLMWDEVDELRSWLPEYVSRIVPLAILTLLRRGEILGLRDRDVDFAAGAVSVSAQSQDGARTRTKTRAGRRTVDVGPLAVRLVREQQLARAPSADGLLFPTRSGGPFDPHNFMSQVYKPAARAAGFPDLTFHDLRHTGASLMVAAGCHVKVIAEQMGHADGGALVLKRYGHLYKGARKQAALALEAHVLGEGQAAAGLSRG
ncbi:MAG: site-specific integrase [Actinobacteria bacterium]|nr:site-specific integrase [Actinomycetota bacterium]